MKPLKVIGIFFFFLHYYLTIAVATLGNLLSLFWKWVRLATLEKHCISPFQATHSYVFAPLRTPCPTQMRQLLRNTQHAREQGHLLRLRPEGYRTQERQEHPAHRHLRAGLRVQEGRA